LRQAKLLQESNRTEPAAGRRASSRLIQVRSILQDSFSPVFEVSLYGTLDGRAPEGTVLVNAIVNLGLPDMVYYE
jgi:hypothetical protein